MPPVNHQILKWARETAGLSIEDAAKAVGLKKAYGQSAAERLTQLESGTQQPSRALLLRMAKRYRRPLIVFYLDSLPKKADRGQDFRRFPGKRPHEIDPALDSLIRDLIVRQRLVRALLDDDEVEVLPFVGSVSTKNDPFETAQKIAATLDFRRDEFRRKRNIDDAFAYLRNRIESSGVFVLLIGDLGSHHSRIPERAFRGYTISDPIAPFIAINDQDARVAWSFSALHELTHLWLGSTGISGGWPANEIEQFCNAVASEILVPEAELRELPAIRSAPANKQLEAISSFAAERNVSRAMVAYRCFRASIIERATWEELLSRLETENSDVLKKKHPRQKDDGGPNYYIVRRHRLGSALLSLVARYLGEGTISHTKAGKVLGVKPRNVLPLLSDKGPGGSS